MNATSFILKGDLCDSLDREHLRTIPGGYLVCVDGFCAGAFSVLPEEYFHLPVLDCVGQLILPGLTDLHVHAPQYAFRGLGMDQELLDWLASNVFPEEARYADPTYAQRAYQAFTQALTSSSTTRACVFATVHRPATELLMDLLEESGLVALVGKVNMDRDCPDSLLETNEGSAAETRRWLEETAGKHKRVGPILTPRFIPSCTDPLLDALGELAAETGLPVQSHLSENRGEVELVGRLCPNAAFYGDAYDRHGLFGSLGKTIMAHCVLSSDEEIGRIKERGVYVAHCPQSNTNLASGVAPIRRYWDEGLNLGLGSDVAGGASLSIFRAMADAIQVSKLRWRLQDDHLRPLTVPEAFWMGTAGGGSFFGQVGLFQPGYEFDAVILDDRRLAAPRPLTVEQRMERAIYLSEDRDVVRKFVQGREIVLAS
ncbi:MAG: amidohydrolase family protein [Pseudoflavonifractor sp.]|nr:amidohydrolase family protein [Pseudoflavonifractor sp.]